MIKGNGYYFSYGAVPLRKIFKRRIKNYLKLDPETLEQLEEVNESINTPPSESQDQNMDDDKDLSLNFTTSSAISRVNIKFLAVYLPVF